MALFALALIWLISLVTYEPTDPVWFFTTVRLHPPANFVGRVGAFLAELSFQLSRLRRVSDPGRHRRGRLALLLVPAVRRDLHESDRRHAALRLQQRIPQPGVRQHRRGRQDVRRRRIDRRVARRLVRGLSQPDRFDHRPADAHDAVGDPVDAVLVRTDVRQREPGIAGSVRPRRRVPARLARGSAQAKAAAGGASPSTRRRRPAATSCQTRTVVQRPKEDDRAGSRPPLRRARSAPRSRLRCRCPTRSRRRPRGARAALHAAAAVAARSRRRPNRRSTSAS